MVIGFVGVFTDLLIQEHSFGYKVFTLIDSGFKISGQAAKPPESLYNLRIHAKGIRCHNVPDSSRISPGIN